MIHVLVVDGHVVFRRNVVGDVVIDDEAKQLIEQREIHLLVDLLELRLHEHVALALFCLVHVLQIVDALAPFVDEKRRRLRV